jgi:glycogen synthase
VKVLMTGDTVGGVWTYIVELTNAMPDVDFVVATMGRLPTAVQLSQLGPNARVEDSVFKLEWMDSPWDDVATAGQWLLDLESRHCPDLIHLNGYAHAALPFRAPKLVVAHSCVLTWWRAVKNKDAPPEWSTYREHVQRGLRGADLVLAPSRAMLSQLHEHYDFAAPERAIYNGRSLACAGAAAGRRTTIFAAGRMWDEAKNLRAVADAAPKLQWPVILAGDGGSDSENLTYVGHLSETEMCDRFAGAGIYLFPTIYEPFGLSILEAALSGCALVIGDIASLREIWGSTAVFVPPRDPDAIAAAVNALIADAGRRNDLARRSSDRARRLSPQAMAAGYEAAYAALRAEAAA